MSVVAAKGLAAARTVLDNGVVVISKEARTVPAVTFQISALGGSIYEPNDLLGLSYLTSRVLDRGTASRSSEEIAEALDARGVAVSMAANRHAVTASCTCLSEDFETLFDLLGDIVMAPAFPQQEVDTRKGEVLSLIRQEEDNPAATAMRHLFALLYPNQHPYGRPARGTLETVGRIGRDDLVQFHEARFAPRRPRSSSWATWSISAPMPWPSVCWAAGGGHAQTTSCCRHSPANRRGRSVSSR